MEERSSGNMGGAPVPPAPPAGGSIPPQPPQDQQSQDQQSPYQQPQYQQPVARRAGAFRATGGLQAWLVICIVLSSLTLLILMGMLALYATDGGAAYGREYIPRFDLWRMYATADLILCVPLILGYALMLGGRKVGFYLVCIISVLNSIMGVVYYVQESAPSLIWAFVAPLLGVLIIWLLMRKQWKWFR